MDPKFPSTGILRSVSIYIFKEIPMDPNISDAASGSNDLDILNAKSPINIQKGTRIAHPIFTIHFKAMVCQSDSFFLI